MTAWSRDRLLGRSSRKGNRLTGTRVGMALALVIVLSLFGGYRFLSPAAEAGARSSAATPLLQDVVFHQLNVTAGTSSEPDSDWGSAAVTYLGSKEVQYLNITVDGSWVVQNVALLSIDGLTSQTITVDFGLPVTPGTAMKSVSYGATVGPAVAGTAPVSSSTAPITPADSDDYCPMGGAQPSPAIPAGVALVGGPLPVDEKGDQKSHAAMPNQESGKGQCAPVAVSNSLLWLNKKYKLGMDDDELTIKKMEKCIGWTPENQAPIDWGERKKKCMDKEKLPVTTYVVSKFAGDPPGQTAINFLNKDDCDLEMNILGRDAKGVSVGHTAAVVDMVRLVGSRGQKTLDIQITVRHDADQGNPGGTADDVIVWNMRNNTISGGGVMLNGMGLTGWVAECPKRD